MEPMTFVFISVVDYGLSCKERRSLKAGYFGKGEKGVAPRIGLLLNKIFSSAAAWWALSSFLSLESFDIALVRPSARIFLSLFLDLMSSFFKLFSRLIILFMNGARGDLPKPSIKNIPAANSQYNQYCLRSCRQYSSPFWTC